MLAAERDSMLEPEAEGQSMLAADGEAEGKGTLGSSASGKRRCRFRDCRCCWERLSPTRRVGPGIDYVDIPAADAADHLPAWSLLVGVTDAASSSLQVSRLRVARSGRILGRSDDALEVFHTIILPKPPGYSFEAGVAPLAPDGRSLCLLRNYACEQPQALQLTLQPQADTKESPLPGIEGTICHCIPISADGHIWALSAIVHDDDMFSVVTRRLVSEPDGGRQWELVGGPFTSPLIHYKFPSWKGEFIQGYVVLPEDNLILVSFQQYGLFLTFAPGSGRWTRVLTDTDEERSQSYLPIFGRGIYVAQHKAVYMLRHNIIYAYELTYQNDVEGTPQLKLDLPVKIDKVCPFIGEKGYGFLTRLGRLMCSVWISLARYDACPCDNLHAIVTTFDLHDRGFKVLHSTFRLVDLVPDPAADQKFCFLQEYEDHGSPVLHQRGEEQEDLSSSQHVDKQSDMLSCCRNMRRMRLAPPRLFQCSKGGRQLAHRCSLQPEEPSSTISPLAPVVLVKPAATTIKKDVFIICQAGSRSVIYQTGAMDADVKPLEPCYVADLGDNCWHFFQGGPKIHAVSSRRGGMLEFSLNKDLVTIKRPVRRPPSDPFVMVIRVGRETIALTETLQVYHQTQFNCGFGTTWLRYTTDDSNVMGRRVVISGYVAVNDSSFIVSDSLTCTCLLFDLGVKQWRTVMPFTAFKDDLHWAAIKQDLPTALKEKEDLPWAAFKEDLPTALKEKEDLPTSIRANGLLNGRCVIVDGFIYTCRNGGLAACELLGEDHSMYLSKPIFFPVSHCVGEDMCLDYAGKDVDSGASLFYVVQGGKHAVGTTEQGLYSPPEHGIQTTTVSITTVKVKTKRTASNKMKPVGIDQMASVTRSLHHTEAIDTRGCFAVSCL